MSVNKENVFKRGEILFIYNHNFPSTMLGNLNETQTQKPFPLPFTPINSSVLATSK